MEHVRLNAMGDARQQSKDLAKLIVSSGARDAQPTPRGTRHRVCRTV
jgi:hypothetical protein